jgi:hypothetical protein
MGLDGWKMARPRHTTKTPTKSDYMISEDQYNAAVKAKDIAQKIISEFHKEARDRFNSRWEEFEVKKKPFWDDDLVYASTQLCPCGHGLAYPKECGPQHHWDCSGYLKGIHNKSIIHTTGLSFAFYSIGSENQPSARGVTTRGVFKPREVENDDRG